MDKSLPSKFIDGWLPKKGVELHGPKGLVEKVTRFLSHQERGTVALKEIENGFETETLSFRNILR
jgi:hypothetical protein